MDCEIIGYLYNESYNEWISYFSSKDQLLNQMKLFLKGSYTARHNVSICIINIGKRKNKLFNSLIMQDSQQAIAKCAHTIKEFANLLFSRGDSGGFYKIINKYFPVEQYLNGLNQIDLDEIVKDIEDWMMI